MKALFRFLADENGFTIPEYALIAGLISFAALASIVALALKFLILFAM